MRILATAYILAGGVCVWAVASGLMGALPAGQNDWRYWLAAFVGMGGAMECLIYLWRAPARDAE